MRTIFQYMIILALTVFASCKKDGEQYDLQAGSFTVNALTVSSNNIVLQPANDDKTAVTFEWGNADFGKQPVVSYTLQLDTPADTSSNHWTTAKNFTIPAGALKYAYLTKELNNLLNTMGLAPGAANAVVVRIKAEVNQYNGAGSTIAPVYTNVVALQVTPYGLSLYVPGDYQGWSPATAPQLAPVAGKPGLYEGYVNMPGGGTHYFKYTNAPDWDHINYGDGGNGSFITDGLAAGLSVPDGGYYYLTADLNNNTWTATKTTWGIIGDATPGGWDNDTQMSYDETAQVWKVTANMIRNGSFKFRANKAWALDFGVDNSGALVYADNPFLGYTPGLNNLSVASDGNYTIILDLHVAGKYTYTLNKN